MGLFNKEQISVLHYTRQNFVKDLLKKIGPTDMIEHYCSRVKENDSIANKLWGKKLNATVDNALEHLTDIIGVRIVVHFIGDVYDIAAKIRSQYKILEEIDYITTPKDNGYRSLHMIVNAPVKTKSGFNGKTIPVEIQIRTVAMDCWASLEHQMLYKKENQQNMELAQKELFHCAENLFSTDMKMEAIQSIIQKTEKQESGGDLH
mgnify:FL=1